ncbi:MAG: glycoside hydrolase family 5 protein [Oscillospiraceae bacterium]|nr:glycoside hydrolase family 5 protein [Oscillospiraceae bacterium]
MLSVSGCVPQNQDGDYTETTGEITTGEITTAETSAVSAVSTVSTERYSPNDRLGEIIGEELPAPEMLEYTPYVPSEHGMRNISSWELLKEIKTGWNLGNTFDAPNSETAWGNPQTTYEMLHAVKETGFDSIRIPVSWGFRTGGAPDYIIEPEMLDRVEEVVGYVMSLDMYCILNTHHETWLLLDEKNIEQTEAQLTAVWKQISERFADYNEKLLFEGMNEPRTIGSDAEWQGGTSGEHRAVNRLNKVFVETVRASGGRNANRHLLVPTYAASAESAAVEALSRGFSTIAGNDNKVIASIHAYTPHSFALRDKGSAQWNPSETHDTDEIDWVFERLQSRFIDKGIPVILGETGAVDRRGNLQARVDWAGYYFGKAAESEIPCYWWDNGLFYSDERPDREHFGLLNRHYNVFIFPEIIDAIMENQTRD